MAASTRATEESHDSAIGASIDYHRAASIGDGSQVCEERLETLAVVPGQRSRRPDADEGRHRPGDTELGQRVREIAQLLDARPPHGLIV